MAPRRPAGGRGRHVRSVPGHHIRSVPSDRRLTEHRGPCESCGTVSGRHRERPGPRNNEECRVSAESELRRYRDGASRHRTAISKTSAEVAAKRKKAADASSAASRSSSSSTVRIKLSEAERATREANAAEQKRAGLEKKLAEAEEKITKAQEKYEKEQRAAQAKALDAIRRQNAQ